MHIDASISWRVTKEDWRGHVGSGGRYTQIVPLNEGSVLLYNPTTGWCMVVRFGSGTLQTIEQQGPKGAASVVAGGQTFALFYWKAGNAELWEFARGAFEQRSSIAQMDFDEFHADFAPVGNENGVILCRARATQSSVARGFRAAVNSSVKSVQHPVSDLRTYSTNYDPFVGSWAHVLGLGVI
jgi:hypothetical protein